VGEEGARSLLRRTPNSSLINQVYGFWTYISLFALTLLITRKVSIDQYGIYAVAASAFNTIAYVIAFGMEDATTTFVPRILAEHGQAAAAALIRKLLSLRVVTLALCMGVLLLGLPVLAALFAAIPTELTTNIAAGLRSPDLQSHVAPIAFWVFANGIFSLLNAVYAAIMRLKIVFIVGGLGQLFLLCLGFVTLQLNWGIDSILWLQGVMTFVGAVIFSLWLLPLIFSRGATYTQPFGPVFRLGMSAWFTNLVSFALLKQISIVLLVYFGATLAQQSFFNLSFQLTDGANLLLVSGFGGVGVAALAAAFVGKNFERLSRAWQALIKIETLLSAPGLLFCLFNASHIVVALYGPKYAAAGSLFATFLVLNLLVRVLGMTIHQSTLYVLGKSRQVIISQWAGLIVVIVLGILLIPRIGPAGALIADGVSRLVTYGTMLAFLWNDLPRRYPLDYSLRLVVAVAIAAVPSLLFQPASKLMLVVFGLIFIFLSTLMLMLTKPLTYHDVEMLKEVKPALVPYLKWFARSA
jgi:O-antigen/teichoic acid export membrane protein